MTALNSIAKPYAQAAFDYAQAQQALPVWQTFLQSLAVITSDSQIIDYVANPKVSEQQIVSLLLGLVTAPNGGENFIRLLVQYHRINALPAIATLYERFVAALDQKIEVSVTSAEPLSQHQQKSIIDALQRRFGKTIELQCEIDQHLLGGAVIRADDLVIDGSATGRLQQLKQQLTRT